MTGSPDALKSALQHPLPSDRVPFQTLIEQVPGVLYVAETGLDGRWLYVSPQIEALLGWTPQEWMADPTLFARCLHPGDWQTEADSALPEQTLPGERNVTEYRLTTKDGRIRWFRDDARLLPDEAGRAVAWSGVLTDFTEQRNSEEMLQRSNRRARTIIDTATDAYVEFDAAGHLREWNHNAGQLFGRTRGDVLGGHLVQIVGAERLQAAQVAILEAAMRETDRPGGRVIELLATRRDGTELPVEVTVWRSDEDEGAMFSAFLRDITDRKRLEDHLTRQAYHDTLTGLANRASFERRLAEHVADSRSSAGKPQDDASGAFAVLLIGIDDLRAVNVSLGHEAAAELLLTVAERLAAHLPEGGFLARVSDDEFAALLTGVGTAVEARCIAESLPLKLRSADESQREVTVRVSVGVRYCAEYDDVPVEDVLSDAGAAMVMATRSGRGIAVFETSMRAANLRRLRLTEALEHAAERGEISVAYQPYFSFSDGRASGVEALARWRHPVHGNVSPAEFISLAESNGLIQSLGLFVLTQACRDIAELRRRHPQHADLTLGVNVSARQLVDGRLQKELVSVLAETGLPGDALMLELTETSLVEDELDVAERLSEIRKLGVHLAVDDFGTRYASLAYLQRFPIDTLKVDRSFVQWLHQSPQEQRLTGAIITLAKTLGLRTIAEGIEEDEAALRLSGLGCDAGQGFLFARPVSLDRLSDVLWAGEKRVHDGLIGVN